jgi:hypothetical protein
MKSFLFDTAIMASLFFPVFLVTFAILWKLRSKGAYTVLLGFAFQVIFLRVGFAIAPQAMQYHHSPGISPVEMGISIGCAMPILFMSLYYWGQWQKEKAERRNATRA